MTKHHRPLHLILVAALAALLAGCSSGSDSSRSTSDITANPTGASVSSSVSSSEAATVEAAPFNASGLLGGNASPSFPAGDAGEVTVVATGPFQKDADLGSATLLVAFRNNTADAVAHVDLSATARAGGQLVATGTSQGTTPSQVAPGEVSLAYIYFDSVGDDVPNKGLDYDFAIDTSDADTSSYNTAAFTVAEADNNGNAIIGTAANKTDAAATGPYSVSVYCFDGGKLADETTSYADQDGDVKPGGMVSFTVDLYDTRCDTYAVGVSGYFA